MRLRQAAFRTTPWEGRKENRRTLRLPASCDIAGKRFTVQLGERHAGETLTTNQVSPCV